MIEANLKSWILSFDELRVLLFSLGFDKNEGILMNEKTFTESEVLFTLHHLTQKSLLSVNEESFEMIPELKKYLTIIGKPESTQVISGEDGREYFVYFGTEEAAVTERYWQRKDAIRITGMPLETYREWRQSIL